MKDEILLVDGDDSMVSSYPEDNHVSEGKLPPELEQYKLDDEELSVLRKLYTTLTNLEMPGVAYTFILNGNTLELEDPETGRCTVVKFEYIYIHVGAEKVHDFCVRFKGRDNHNYRVENWDTNSDTGHIVEKLCDVDCPGYKIMPTLAMLDKLLTLPDINRSQRIVFKEVDDSTQIPANIRYGVVNYKTRDII